MKLAGDLLATATRLAKASPGKPKQADLRRAISTAYYALFHALAEDAANLLVGVGRAAPDEAWTRIYRALDHTVARNACRDARSQSALIGIATIADTFLSLQIQRQNADYDPMTSFSRAEALDAITQATIAIRSLAAADKTTRKAFAVHLLHRRR